MLVDEMAKPERGPHDRWYMIDVAEEGHSDHGMISRPYQPEIGAPVICPGCTKIVHVQTIREI